MSWEIKPRYTGDVIRSGDGNLSRANLSRAYLCGANLSGANLRGADLSGADLSGADLPHFQICPKEGAFIAYKKADGYVLKLEIPADARRTSSLVGRKCRAEFVRVLAVKDPDDGPWPTPVGKEFETRGGCVYRVGEITYPDKYDDDIRVECTHGIHFFMTEKEAQEW